MKSSKFRGQLALALGGPSIVLVCLSVMGKSQPGEAFLNCFTPNMFKMGGKGGAAHQQVPALAYAAHPGERSSWYPQQTVQAPPSALAGYGYQNPMSRLFKPKWGGGLFGPKRWMDWRMNAANMNFYRPGYGYWPPASPGQTLNPLSPSSINYNTQLTDQLQTPYNPSGISTQIGSSTGNQYGFNPSVAPQVTNNYNTDGWTVPYVSPYGRPNQHSQYGGGDSYSVLPGGGNNQSNKQQVDPYGTKGGAGGNKQQQQQQPGQYGTTKK